MQQWEGLESSQGLSHLQEIVPPLDAKIVALEPKGTIYDVGGAWATGWKEIHMGTPGKGLWPGEPVLIGTQGFC